VNVERHSGSLSGLPDDRLGTLAVSLVVSELQWTPDLAPAVLDRISRDAVAYPEQFDRRTRPPAHVAVPPYERSAKRTVGRLGVFAIVLALVVVLVLVVATASGVNADAVLSATISALSLPIDAIDGRLA
jgi:hypothetical protein